MKISRKSRLSIFVTAVISGIAFVATSYVHAHQVDGETSYNVHLADLPLFKSWTPKGELPLSEETRVGLQKELATQDPGLIKDGLFVLGPGGRMYYIGRRSELDVILGTLTSTHDFDGIPAQPAKRKIRLSWGHGGGPVP